MPRKTTPAIAPTHTPKTRDELRADLGRQLTTLNLSNPDPDALAEFCAVLDEMPDVWAHLVDVGRSTRDVIIKQMGGAVMREGIQRQVKVMQDGMGYDASSTLERGLIEHVVACWLRLQQVEGAYNTALFDTHAFARGDYWERRLSGAQRRYVRACESLARVRRLTRPGPGALQVNIGGQQVNVAGGVAGDVEEGSK